MNVYMANELKFEEVESIIKKAESLSFNMQKYKDDLKSLCINNLISYSTGLNNLKAELSIYADIYSLVTDSENFYPDSTIFAKFLFLQNDMPEYFDLINAENFKEENLGKFQKLKDNIMEIYYSYYFEAKMNCAIDNYSLSELELYDNVNANNNPILKTVILKYLKKNNIDICLAKYSDLKSLVMSLAVPLRNQRRLTIIADNKVLANPSHDTLIPEGCQAFLPSKNDIINSRMFWLDEFTPGFRSEPSDFARDNTALKVEGFCTGTFSFGLGHKKGIWVYDDFELGLSNKLEFQDLSKIGIRPCFRYSAIKKYCDNIEQYKLNYSFANLGKYPQSSYDMFDDIFELIGTYEYNSTEYPAYIGRRGELYIMDKHYNDYIRIEPLNLLVDEKRDIAVTRNIVLPCNIKSFMAGAEKYTDESKVPRKLYFDPKRIEKVLTAFTKDVFKSISKSPEKVYKK